jgi:hypothetical protein
LLLKEGLEIGPVYVFRLKYRGTIKASAIELVKLKGIYIVVVKINLANVSLARPLELET